MAHKLVTGIDRMVSTLLDTIWHRDETLADGRLQIVAHTGDAEQTMLQMASKVWPIDADNDVARAVALVTADGTPIDSHMATLSPSGRVLGVVTSGYSIISGKVIMQEWLLALARAGGIPETLGTFDAGRSMFGCVQIADAWRVPGDHSETRAMFNVVTNHTGEGGIRGSFASFRVVCANTAAVYSHEHDAVTDAKERAARAWVSVRHTVNAVDRMREAVAWITDGRARAEQEQATLARLAAKMVSTAEVDAFMARYISTDGVSDRAAAHRSNQRDAFMGALTDASDLGEHVLGAKGISGYGLLQAVTRFEDHISRTRGASDQPVSTRRAFRAFMGEREAEKVAAREYILAL